MQICIRNLYNIQDLYTNLYASLYKMNLSVSNCTKYIKFYRNVIQICTRFVYKFVCKFGLIKICIQKYNIFI